MLVRVVRILAMESKNFRWSDMDLETINRLLDEINEDRTVPRNIRALIQEAKSDLGDTEKDMTVRISSAISLLDSVSNDPNIPIYTRTQVWSIVSMLESMNKNG